MFAGCQSTHGTETRLLLAVNAFVKQLLAVFLQCQQRKLAAPKHVQSCWCVAMRQWQGQWHFIRGMALSLFFIAVLCRWHSVASGTIDGTYVFGFYSILINFVRIVSRCVQQYPVCQCPTISQPFHQWRGLQASWCIGCWTKLGRRSCSKEGWDPSHPFLLIPVWILATRNKRLHFCVLDKTMTRCGYSWLLILLNLCWCWDVAKVSRYGTGSQFLSGFQK